MAGTSFAPTIEIELPSGDILEMTQNEFDAIQTRQIDLTYLIMNTPKPKLSIFREEDIQAFLDWTKQAQANEPNKPVGANTPTGQQRIKDIIGVTDTSLPPEARSFLNSIADIEGGTYTNRFGGGELPDPNQHPMDKVKAWGQESSAAGRYQINKDTWTTIRNNNPDIQDFSPANQDKGAWWWAQHQYKVNTGRDLLADLKAGDTSRIKPALENTWAALRVKPFRYEQPNPDAQTPPAGTYQRAAIDYANQQAIRKGKLDPALEERMSQSAVEVFGPGYRFRVHSGGQESNKPGEGTGSIRHNQGHAGDAYLIDPQGNIVNDRATLNKFKDHWVANDYGSIGTFMKDKQGNLSMHIDDWTKAKLKPGMGTTWDYGN